MRILRYGPVRPALAALLALACSGGPATESTSRGELEAPDLGPGVARSLAAHRARTISNLAYEIFLSIPDSRSESIDGRLTARFDLSEADEPLVFDFAQPGDNVLSVTVGGEAVPFATRDEHVVVPADSLAAGANEVTIAFVAGDGSLNRADEFLYSLFVPDRARVAMPIFDQPDLKARFQLTLEVPADWEAVTNGARLERLDRDGRSTVRFAESRPISTYVFAFAAGRFDVVSAERAGRMLRMLHRETDTEKVERNLEAIFDLHGAALEWLEQYTGIPYAFDKLDFVAMPAFQYGGMEHTGAIFYRDRSLFLDETATQSQVLGRASLIAHEVAHMWFGNLVTMEWFSDVWMKEVFANFMAAKIVNPSFPDVDHELRFLLAHYPTAYGVDRTAGANPIRQPLANLNEAGSLYGAIIYQKAPIVMKHLELLMGEEPFRDGLREYLEANAFANATWPDLIEVLDRRTEEDLAAWSQVWVNEPGRPTIEVRLEVGDSEIESLSVHQSDPAGGGRRWNQRLDVLLGYADGQTRTAPVHLRDPSVTVDGIAGEPIPAYVLANGAGVAYGNFVLAAETRDYLVANLPSIPQARIRAVAWLSLWDALLGGDLDPMAFVDLAVRAVPEETDELNLQRILGYLETTFWRYLSADARAKIGPRIEALLWRQLETAPRATLKGAYFDTYRSVGLSDSAVGRLRGLWSGDIVVDGLSLAENDTTALAQAIAVRGGVDAEAILDRQRERIENPDNVLRFDFVRPALSADRGTRDAFFAALAEEANRERERWVLEALGFLHHPLRATEAEGYIRPSLELLEEVQRTGDIFFPLGWLSANLSGHQTASAAAVVRRFLDERPDLPDQLRGKLLQAADPLFRAARIVGDDSS